MWLPPWKYGPYTTLLPLPTVSSLSWAVWRMGMMILLTSSSPVRTSCWRVALVDLDGPDRVRQGVGQLARAVLRVGPAEQTLDDAVVGEQVRQGSHMGVALDGVEDDGIAAVEALLDAGQLQVGIDLGVGFEQQALTAQPVDGGGQRDQIGSAEVAVVAREALRASNGLGDGHIAP